jgi:hypothetical protein
VSAAHHYLRVDKAWFAKNIRPFLLVLHIPMQTKAYQGKDPDAPPAQSECERLGPRLTDVARDYVNGEAPSSMSAEREVPGFAGTSRGEDALIKVELDSDHRDLPSSQGSYFIQRCNAAAADRNFRAHAERIHSK